MTLARPSLNSADAARGSAVSSLDVANVRAILAAPTRAARPLTERQARVLAFVVDRVLTVGLPPTLREIADHMGIASTHGAAEHVAALVRKGALVQSPGLSRGLRVVGLPPRRVPPVLAVSLHTIHDSASRPVAHFYPFATNDRGTNR